MDPELDELREIAIQRISEKQKSSAASSPPPPIVAPRPVPEAPVVAAAA